MYMYHHHYILLLVKTSPCPFFLLILFCCEGRLFWQSSRFFSANHVQIYKVVESMHIYYIWIPRDLILEWTKSYVRPANPFRVVWVGFDFFGWLKLKIGIVVHAYQISSSHLTLCSRTSTFWKNKNALGVTRPVHNLFQHSLIIYI